MVSVYMAEERTIVCPHLCICDESKKLFLLIDLL